MSFSPHINNIVTKASKMLNFIKCNLHECSEEVKSLAFRSLVRPILEYSSPVWDPYLAKDIQALEKVQRRAAHWVMSDYSWSSSVTVMLDHLGWPTLAECRLFARLSTFYKIVHRLSAPQLPSYFPTTNRLTRQYRSLHFVIPPSRTNYHLNSDWNNLPISTIEPNSMNFRRISHNRTITIIYLIYDLYVSFGLCPWVTPAHCCLTQYLNSNFLRQKRLLVSFCLSGFNVGHPLLLKAIY